MESPVFPLSRRNFLGAAGLVVAAGGGLLSASAAAAWAQDDKTALRAVTHPGLLHNADDLARMKAAVAARESPIYDGYLTFAAHARSKSTYTIQNTGQITSWGRGPTNFQNQAVADSAAAVEEALSRDGVAADLAAEAGGLKLFVLAGFYQGDDERLARAPGRLTGVIGAAPAPLDV